MSTLLWERRLMSAASGRPEECWLWESCSDTAEALRFVQLLAEAMGRAGYPLEDRRGMQLALEEALVNAVKHGNKGDPSRRVRVQVRLGPARVLAEVEDEGEGFDPSQVPDPRARATWSARGAGACC
jgi:serine/threonine-protein kinase RsbW